MGIPRFALAALAAAAASNFHAGPAHANGTPATYQMVTGVCVFNNTLNGLTFSGYSSCQAAFADALSFYPPHCKSNALQCTFSCPALGAFPLAFPGMEIGWGTIGNTQAGCDNNQSVRAVCADGPGQNTPDGVVCPARPMSIPRNIGFAGSCPEGKCEGNPINPAIGNKFQTEPDYAGTGPFPLRFARYYNSFNAGQGTSRAPIGTLWSHTYSRSLIFDPGGSKTLVAAAREDGKTLAFRR